MDSIQVFGVFLFMYLADFYSDDWRVFIQTIGEFSFRRLAEFVYLEGA